MKVLEKTNNQEVSPFYMDLQMAFHLKNPHEYIKEALEFRIVMKRLTDGGQF